CFGVLRTPTLFPYTTLFRSSEVLDHRVQFLAAVVLPDRDRHLLRHELQKPRAVNKSHASPALVPIRHEQVMPDDRPRLRRCPGEDRKSTRLNSSHVKISYAV